MTNDTLLVKNAKIWSWEQKQFVADCIRVEDGKIIARGPEKQVKTKSKDVVVDMSGKYILPGLVDAHMHVKLLGKTSQQVVLNGVRSIAEFQQVLADFAKNNPTPRQITGVGWDHELMGGTMPTMDDIDAVVKDRPVILSRCCWHICVANRLAFEESGLDINAPPVVEGGSFDVDTKTGRATGVARERATHFIVEAPPSRSVAKNWIVNGLQAAVSTGLTSVQTNDNESFEIYRELEDADELPLRVHLTPVAADVVAGKDISAPYESKLSQDMLRCDRVKLFADGALGAGTAALIGGYQDEQENPEGTLQHTPDDLLSLMEGARALGFRLETHAIGDLAAQVVLQSYEAAKVKPKDRAILTHAQVLNEGLIAQMKELGVVADVQPSFVPTDAAWCRKRLQPEKIPMTYCWKTLLDAGVHVAGGSDAPVENVSPFVGLYDAVFREERIGKSDETRRDMVYLPEEKLSFPEALHLYTTGAAYAAGMEHRRGALEVGFDADFCVIGVDVNQEPRLLKTCQNDLQVWVHGRKRYDSSAAANAVETGKPQRSDFVPGKGGDVYRQARKNPMTCHCHAK